MLERAIELLKNDETLVIVDPAMADNGKYYANLGDKMTECFRRLIKKADIITPNITEACFLTGMEYRPGTHSMAYVTELIDRLSELGPNFVAVTGVSAEPGKVGIVARDNKSGRLCSVMNEALDGTFHGSGGCAQCRREICHRRDRTHRKAKYASPLRARFRRRPARIYKNLQQAVRVVEQCLDQVFGN